MPNWKRILLPLLVVTGVVILVQLATAVTRDIPQTPPPTATTVTPPGDAVVDVLDEHLARRWEQAGLTPAEPADDLTVYRRLSLSLHGTIPSLEEIRRFESDAGPHRLARWTEAMLEDSRFADYWSRRLARTFVGVEEGQFILFRRDRFHDWLAERLRENRPYDETVRHLIADTGVWTGDPATNYITAAFANDELNPEKLTARTVRAFLGQRMDCAQCHDHPFADWKQSQFEGLAAHYGQVNVTIVGVEDKPSHLFDLPADAEDELVDGEPSAALRRVFRKAGHGIRKYGEVKTVNEDELWLIRDGFQLADADDEYVADDDGQGEPVLEARYVVYRTDGVLQVSGAKGEHVVQDRDTLEDRIVPPSVPFHPEWLPAEGTRRQQLAAWITHPENRRFDRAVANRVWGLMFGRPYMLDRPVDDLPDPEDESYADDTRVLDIVGADFREHGYDLRRMITVIAGSQAFRLSSLHVATSTAAMDTLKHRWAVFPLVRLRPEQVIGAMLQASSIKTIDQQTNLLFRTVRFFREIGFVNEYGDAGEAELQDRVGTISQALLRMNGELSRELTKQTAINASGRIAGLASDAKTRLDVCYLVCLTRRPTAAERDHFEPLLADEQTVKSEGIIQGIFWVLFNSAEFSWNH